MNIRARVDTVKFARFSFRAERQVQRVDEGLYRSSLAEKGRMEPRFGGVAIKHHTTSLGKP